MPLDVPFIARNDGAMKKLSLILNLSFFFIPACSRLELAATWANAYIADQIDQYFDMNSMQSLFVKKAVKEDIDKIKTEIFPGVAEQLDRIEILIKSNASVNALQVNHFHSELKQIFYSGLKVFEPNAQKFVRKINEEQLDYFKKEFNKKSAELTSDLENPASAKQKRFDNIRSHIEIWVGPLGEEQKLLIQQFSNDNLLPLKELIQIREKLSKEFLESFKNIEKRRKFINTLFTNYESMLESSFIRATEKDQKKYFELIASVINKLDPKQRNHLVQILNDRSDELKKMSENKKERLSYMFWQ